MTKQILIGEELLIKKATKLLMDNLGSVETIRFLSMPVHKRVESLKRHHQWQKEIDKEDFLNQIFS
jgi:hypothetical protein